jgi:hypothetical protein
MRIEFLENKGSCKKGEVHDQPEAIAKSLVERKIAKPADEIAAEVAPDSDEPLDTKSKRKRS